MSLQFGDFELDQEQRQLLRAGQAVPLEPKAYELLSLLLMRRPRALSRAQIRDVVWPEVFISESTLGVAVNSIRQALDDDARKPRFIRTVRGFGYAFCGEARDTADGPAPPEGGAARVADARPYPGLSAFTEADAAFFFGREDEVAALWDKVRRQPLLAVIGPSGVGKTSFLRAGVVPGRPDGWRAALTTPGSSPVFSLAQALLPGLVGDAEAMAELLEGVRTLGSDGEPDRVASAVRRWRQGSAEALVVVDQFEELFTLSPSEVQARFALLLRSLAEEADLHVLLSLRDDFLFRCSEQEALRPVFKDLTPLTPPSPEALRRALVEPAARRGVRFEDESLVEQMVDAVGVGRGALPLLAFAVSRLWEERDRERSLLTRESYARIGGVAGALSHHAEATLTRLGPEWESAVREIFRNLATAEGTRAARQREDLLSVFGEERDGAEAVLDSLVDARLLTEYEAPESDAIRATAAESVVEGFAGAPNEQADHRRIEVVHESLLTHWPRLVRWQAQDADGALLRDQLRQAARLWDDKGRPDELLWAGSAYREFALWRERYPGGLSAVEGAFASGMTALTGRRRRRRRAAVAATVALLAVGLTLVTALWGRSEAARRKASTEARRAEASKLLALGQIELEDYPTAALAYAMRSLELADTLAARLFALRAVQQGPTAFVYRFPAESQVPAAQMAFSANGEWLAAGGFAGAQVFHRDGRAPIVFRDFPNIGIGPGFIQVGLAPDGRVLVTARDGEIRAWSLPEGRALWTSQSPDGPGTLLARDDAFFTSTTVGSEEIVRRWSFTGESRVLGTMPGLPGFSPDIHGDRLIYRLGPSIYVRSFDRWDSPRLLGRHPADVESLAFGPGGDTFAAWDTSGELRVWFTDGSSARPLRVHAVDGKFGQVALDPSGRWLSFAHGTGLVVARLWDLGAPAASPLQLRKGRVESTGSAFHPSGRWMATSHGSEVALWWLGGAHSRVLTGHAEGFVGTVAFTADGAALLSGGQDGTVRRWPLDVASGEGPKILLGEGETINNIVIAHDTRQALVADWYRIVAVPLDGGPSREIAVFPKNLVLNALAVSDDGRRLASAPVFGPTGERVLQVRDLETGSARAVGGPVPDAEQTTTGGLVLSLDWLDDEAILASVFPAGLVSFDVESGDRRVLCPEPNGGVALSTSREFGVGVNRSDATNNARGVLVRFGLDGEPATPLPSHGTRVFSTCVALDSTDTLVASGSIDGVVRVGPVTGEEPHLFFGHEGIVLAVAFSPDGRWLASAGMDGTIRLWPMPDVSKPPPHALPHDELLARLRSLTNLRAVPDADSPTGYRIEPGPFPGWSTEPTW